MLPMNRCAYSPSVLMQCYNPFDLVFVFISSLNFVPEGKAWKYWSTIAAFIVCWYCIPNRTNSVFIEELSILACLMLHDCLHCESTNTWVKSITTITHVVYWRHFTLLRTCGQWKKAHKFHTCLLPILCVTQIICMCWVTFTTSLWKPLIQPLLSWCYYHGFSLWCD